jgi:hypothetical protein
MLEREAIARYGVFASPGATLERKERSSAAARVRAYAYPSPPTVTVTRVAGTRDRRFRLVRVDRGAGRPEGDRPETASAVLPSVRELLFPGAGSASRVEQRLEERSALEPAVRRLAGVPRRQVGDAVRRVSSIVAGFLEMDAFDLLAAGWRGYEPLTTAARQTDAAPGEEQVFELATHRVTSCRRPSVDLEIDDAPVGSVDVQIDVSFVLRAVRAVVSGGRLTGLRAGLVDAEVRLSCEGAEVASASRRIDLAAEGGLGAGISLIEYAVDPSAGAGA